MSFIVDENKLIEDTESHFIFIKFKTWFYKNFNRPANLSFRNDNRMYHAFVEGFSAGKIGLYKDWEQMSKAME